jgi:hypothetical protein
MSNAIHPYYVVMTNDKHGPFWNLSDAVEAAKAAEAVGRLVTKIEQRGDTILDGDVLKHAIAEI